jgi:hypothetical protein
MSLPRLSRAEIAFVIGVPLAWAVLLLFHPGGEGDQIYADLDGDGTRMLVVHVGTLIFIPLLAFAIYVLLRGNQSTAARISRIALVVFVVFYSAWETLQGIANGILVDKVSALPEAERGMGADLIQEFAESPLARDFGVFSIIGSLAGAPRWAPAVFGVAGLLITAHPPPFGPSGLVIFAVAVVVVFRGRPVAEPLPKGNPKSRAVARE